MPPADPPREDADLPALGWVRRAQAEKELLRAIEERVVRRRRRRWAGASCGLILAVAGASLWSANFRKAAPARAGADTTAAILSAPRRESLADGSTVELKEGAEIKVDFGGRLRRVSLLKGAAHFAVAPDHNRPFVVTADGVQVRAVGTAFAVQLSPGSVEVLVTEGRVAVDKTSGEPASASGGIAPTPRTIALVDALHRMVVGAGGVQTAAPRVESVTGAEMADRLSWRVPRLELSRTPLSQVVELMNRRSPVHFVIGDPALGDLKLSGYLRADNTEGLVRLLELRFGVTAHPRGRDEIVLRAAP